MTETITWDLNLSKPTRKKDSSNFAVTLSQYMSADQR